MRTLRNLPVPQDGDNVKFPDGQIQNETTTKQGTPVVREIYGDVITNLYAILRDVGIVPTETEDGSTTQYQILDALRVFSNKVNDLQQLLTVNGTYITTGLNIDNLPNDYVFIGKVTEDILESEVYTLVGSGNDSYPLTSSSNITASSIVLVVLNSAGSLMVSIDSAVGSSSGSVLETAMGTPLAFNESKNLLFYSDGNILTSFPKVHTVEALIQANQATGDIKIVDVVLLKGKLICFTLNEVTLKYQAFAFAEANLDVLEGEIDIPDLSGVDNQPYMYCDGEFLYFTNTQTVINESVNNYDLGKFSFDEVALEIAGVSFSSLDNNFKKTTNVFIDKINQKLYTFTNGDLYDYAIGGAARVSKGFFNTINGVVFKFDGQTYYSNGNVGTKWNY